MQSLARRSLHARSAARAVITYTKLPTLGFAENAASLIIQADISTGQSPALRAFCFCAAGSTQSFAHLGKSRHRRVSALPAIIRSLRKFMLSKAISSDIWAQSTPILKGVSVRERKSINGEQ